MKKILLFAVILYFCSYWLIADDKKKYLSRIVPPYPELHLERGSILVGFDNTSKKARYVISRTDKNGVQYFWFTKEIARKVDNTTTMQTVDILILEKPNKNFFFATGLCKQNGKFDDRIIALIKYNEQQAWFSDVQQAWLANTELEKIQMLPVKGISCINEGFGL